MLTSHFTIHIIKVPKRPTMCVHDVSRKSTIFYPIMKVLISLPSAFVKNIVGLTYIMNVKCYIKKVHSYLLSTFMIEAANLNGFGIKRLKTSKAV
jgi:hypothetical protein